MVDEHVLLLQRAARSTRACLMTAAEKKNVVSTWSYWSLHVLKSYAHILWEIRVKVGHWTCCSVFQSLSTSLSSLKTRLCIVHGSESEFGVTLWGSSEVALVHSFSLGHCCISYAYESSHVETLPVFHFFYAITDHAFLNKHPYSWIAPHAARRSAAVERDLACVPRPSLYTMADE